MNSLDILTAVLAGAVLAGAVSGFVLWFANHAIERDFHSDERSSHDL